MWCSGWTLFCVFRFEEACPAFPTNMSLRSSLHVQRVLVRTGGGRLELNFGPLLLPIGANIVAPRWFCSWMHFFSCFAFQLRFVFGFIFHSVFAFSPCFFSPAVLFRLFQSASGDECE